MTEGIRNVERKLALETGCCLNVDLGSGRRQHLFVKRTKISNIPLTMDTSAREAMKDAAKCDKHCELQISANQ